MQRKKRVLFIFGTRPEAIKLAPLIKLLEREKLFDVKVCVTAQHREMLDNIVELFKIRPNYDLDLMRSNQTLFDITANALKELEKVISETAPNLIFVQGDTTTAFVGALAGYYKCVPVAHIEAGLRSGDKRSPFPEEMNRALVGRIADYHFAPTRKAYDNLVCEGIKCNIWEVGNTVIDALHLCLEMIKEARTQKYSEFFKFADFSKSIVLITQHRRESFGAPLENVCYAIKELARTYEEIVFIYPVHLNPNVKKTVTGILAGQNNIHLIEPLGYSYLVYLMSRSYLIITDSGGIQEEAPSLGIPVVVTRDVTERVEGVKAGTSILTGTDRQKIIEICGRFIRDKKFYKMFAKAKNPYGEGDSSKKIVAIINEIFASGEIGKALVRAGSDK